MTLWYGIDRLWSWTGLNSRSFMRLKYHGLEPLESYDFLRIWERFHVLFASALAITFFSFVIDSSCLLFLPQYILSLVFPSCYTLDAYQWSWVSLFNMLLEWNGHSFPNADSHCGHAVHIVQKKIQWILSPHLVRISLANPPVLCSPDQFFVHCPSQCRTHTLPRHSQC